MHKSNIHLTSNFHLKYSFVSLYFHIHFSLDIAHNGNGLGVTGVNGDPKFQSRDQTIGSSVEWQGKNSTEAKKSSEIIVGE